MLNKSVGLILGSLVLLVVAACGPAGMLPAPSPEETIALPAYDARPLPTERGSLFAGSGLCASCHTDMADRAGTDVSIDTAWRASMMANASRDPYWQAAVRAETLDLPSLQSVVEDKCATCHTPMAHFAAVAVQDETALFDQGFLDPGHPRHAFAADGVSCTLCHQIERQGLGDPNSFSGGFSIDTQRPAGQRVIYGPYFAPPRPASVMEDVSGYRPVQGPHTLSSEHCATCHTLYTPYVDQDGGIVGTFPEQVPYLEWRHSDYEQTHVCQDCHMPPAEGAVRLSTTGGGPPRSPFARHLFVGGNTYVLSMLSILGDELGVTASSDHFARKIDETLDQLQSRAASLTIEEVSAADSLLTLMVAVRSQAGHKLPTGFPARRVWLHVTVEDALGEVLFESGAANPDGSIVGNAHDADPAVHEPHYDEITAAEQVQIYEAVMEDVSRELTTGLLRAQGYRKDNRLLPAGFDKASAHDDVAVYGAAAADDDFTAGGDTVRYLIDLPNAAGELTVTVRLLYQSVGYRWADNLRRHDAPEITHFLDAYDALPNRPVVLAAAVASLEP